MSVKVSNWSDGRFEEYGDGWSFDTVSVLDRIDLATFFTFFS
jgi:hypothetical protein